MKNGKHQRHPTERRAGHNDDMQDALRSGSHAGVSLEKRGACSFEDATKDLKRPQGGRNAPTAHD